MFQDSIFNLAVRGSEYLRRAPWRFLLPEQYWSGLRLRRGRIWDAGGGCSGSRRGRCLCKNPDNIVYADLNEFADNFGNEVGISNLKQEILNFRQNPTAEGIVLKGKKRSALKLFVPDMLFDKHIEMGENVWVFIGETYPAYCIY